VKRCSRKGAHPSSRENPEWFLETSETPLKPPLGQNDQMFLLFYKPPIFWVEITKNEDGHLCNWMLQDLIVLALIEGLFDLHAM